MDELNKEFQKNGLGEYNKNDANIFEKITNNGRIHTAIENCERINECGQASQRNPMTKVYKIVEGLKEYLE